MKTLRLSVFILIVGILPTGIWAKTAAQMYELQYPSSIFDQKVEEILIDIAEYLKINVIFDVSPKGLLTSPGTTKSVGELLDEISYKHSILWYLSNGFLHITSDKNITEYIFDIKNVDTNKITNKILELGVADPKYPISFDINKEIALVSGPTGYVKLISQIIEIAGGHRLNSGIDEVSTNDNEEPKSDLPKVYRGRSG